MTYSIAGIDKLETVNKLLYASYHPDEPITRHLDLFKGLNSIPDADSRVERTIRRNLSMLAYDKQGKVIGVCINNSYDRQDFLQLLEQVFSLVPNLSSLESQLSIFLVHGRGHRPDVQALPCHPQGRQGEEHPRLR